jgi:GxxExxY protein
MEPIPQDTEETAKSIVDGAFKVHSSLGPGLIESVYETCLFYELGKRGLRVQRQIRVPVIYDGQNMDVDLRLDLLVNDHVVVELKAIEKLIPLHRLSFSLI